MKTYVVYVIWTESKIVQAETEAEAYKLGQPKPRRDNLSLANWHIQVVEHQD